jgi:FkbM family methyltransferase
LKQRFLQLQGMKMQSELIADRDFGMNVALNGLRQRGYSPKVIYDIGAADGAWARFALGVFPEARIVCFEPLAERAELLKKFESQSEGRVRFLNVGVGNTDAELQIGVSESLYDSSFAYGASISRTVSVRTLETLLRTESLELPSFVKIDVQGFEKRVIDGGPSVFAHADLVLMECQFLPFCEDMRTLDQTIAHMSSIGFIPYEFVDLLRRPLDNAMGQCDILFVKRGHQLVSNLSWG